MEVSGQVHAPATLSPWEELLIPIECVCVCGRVDPRTVGWNVLAECEDF